MSDTDRPAMPGAESTAAALARAERERDQLAAMVDDLSADLTNAQHDRDDAYAELAVTEVLELRAELASARAKLDTLRREQGGELDRVRRETAAVHLAVQWAAADPYYAGEPPTAREIALMHLALRCLTREGLVREQLAGLLRRTGEGAATRFPARSEGET